MDLIILTDGMYHLVEVTKEMMTDMMLFNKDQINFFDLCDIIRFEALQRIMTTLSTLM